jgi:LuxR family maltose regulon positive regulatory protein
MCDAVLANSASISASGKDILEQVSYPNSQSSSQNVLEHLERSNLFLVPLDDERQWYRYHPLFAGFLQERLLKTQPDRWAELHRRAAEWCEANGMIAEAVNHALALGDARQALFLVEQIAEAIWMSGEMVRLSGWLQALPDEMIRSRPRLCIFHAWILNIKAEYEARDARLQDVARSLEREDLSVQERSVIQGMLATTRAIVAIMCGDAASAKELCSQALELLPDENLVWRCVVYRNLGNAYLLDDRAEAARQVFCQAYEISQQAGNIYMALISMYELGELDIALGRLRQAARTLEQALQLAEEKGAPGLTITGALHVGLSEVLREWNDVEAGVQHAQAGIELGQRDGSVGVQVSGYTRLAGLLQAGGDANGAEQALQKALSLAPSLRRVAFIAHQDAQARLWWRQGNPLAALRWLEQSGLNMDGEISFGVEAGYLTLARCLLYQKKLDDAYRLLARLQQTAERAGRLGRVIEILTLQALTLQAQGNGAAALERLKECLVQAEPEGYLRLFLDEGKSMQLLLEKFVSWIEKKDPFQNQKTEQILMAFAQKILAAYPDRGTNRVSIQNHPSNFLNISEALSARELDVLRLIAAGLSNQEIARELVVAPSTVHWHTKNIYGKLNVHNRTQASWHARQLGLVG